MILTHGANSTGSGSTGMLYYTDFSNFDYSTKVDTPIIGIPTQYDTGSSFTYSSTSFTYDGVTATALNIKNSAKNAASNKIDVDASSVTELIAKFVMFSSSTPAFVWFGNIGFYWDGNKGNYVGILLDSSYSDYTLKNGTTLYNTSYGYRWLLTSQSSSDAHKLGLKYHSGSVTFLIDDIEYLTLNVTPTSPVALTLDPRNGNSISVSEIKVTPC